MLMRVCGELKQENALRNQQGGSRGVTTSPGNGGKTGLTVEPDDDMVSQEKKTSSTYPFHCPICGRRDFMTGTEAQEHEAKCYNPHGPWLCSICGKTEFTTSQAFAGHWRCCNKGSIVTEATLSLLPPEYRTAAGQLSDFNQLVTSCIELFEATKSDCEKQNVGNGRRKVSVGNLGIRCRHCAKQGVMTIGSTAYTSDLKTIPHNIYVMVQRHLFQTCKSVSKHLKTELETTKKDSTSQSVKKGGLGLPTYLRMLNDHFKLTDDGKRDGVRRVRAKSSETEGNRF